MSRIPLEGHPYHNKSDSELLYIARDAHAAAKAIQGHDSQAECKYLDQVNDACTVMYYRRQCKAAFLADMAAKRNKQC